MAKNVSLFKVIHDLTATIKWSEVSVVAFISLVLSLLIYDINDFAFCKLQNLVYDYMPNLMGFSLTMYVVLFGVEGFIIERLKIKADDNKMK